MLHLEGTAVSPGYASGIATVYNYELERRIELPDHAITRAEVEAECKRIDDALAQSSRELMLIEQTALNDPRLLRSAAILSAHISMANEIAAVVKQHVGRECVNVEQALDSVVRDFVERFQHLNDPCFREREQDVRDVGRRMTRHLRGCLPWANTPLPPGSVIVAYELLPSEIVELAKSGVVAIISEHGGKFSHTAIVARSLGIPAIMGIPNIATQIQPGMQLLVDGESGSVGIMPSQLEVESFAKRKQQHDNRVSEISSKEHLPSVTQDGTEITLLANIGRPEEIARIGEHHLNGAGLFRTEFLFLESHERPTFELQADIYDKMAKGLEGLPLVIRTFDLGGDKLPPFLLLEESEQHASLCLRRIAILSGRTESSQEAVAGHLACRPVV